MSAPDPLPPAPPVNPPPYRDTPALGGDVFMTLISAGLFLYVGFGLALTGISGSPLYDGSVACLTWGARGIGLALLIVAALRALAHFGVLAQRHILASRGVDLLDLALAAAATLLCAGVGLIWLRFADTTGILLLIFALLNGNTTRAAWSRWQATQPAPP
jgi:hypothetical protein